ncbi:alpha/beta-hydrolase [Hymenopellis radicata]|nr:alpha/beta-hydrolase [Hymenopellis radicata]
MDPSLYKDVTVSRGLKYHYFLAPATDSSKPVLLLLHGFPSTSWDWKEQVSFFRKEGYGLIVPDMLGYGGTASPEDPAAYLSSLIVKDVIDILDAEKVSQAVVIGHDWGAKVASRLANYFPDRFIAYAFMAVAYVPPSTENKYEAMLEFTKKAFGYELFGYWRFFSEPDAVEVVEAHMDSFISILYGKDSHAMSHHFAPLGALRAWLAEDKRAEPADYLTAEEREFHKKELLDTGMTGPFNWYKILTSGLDAEDNKGISPENIVIIKPTFFGGAKNDRIALADVQLKSLGEVCPNLTYREFDAGHWVLWEAKDEVNQELLMWIQGLSV